MTSKNVGAFLAYVFSGSGRVAVFEPVVTSQWFACPGITETMSFQFPSPDGIILQLQL